MSENPVDRYVDQDGKLKVPMSEVPEELQALVISVKTARQMAASQ